MKISIITAVYNRADLVGDAIQSVVNQDYPDIEHVIIDGGSTDGTMKVIRNAAPRNPILVSEPDNGIYDALNKGIRTATGDVIGLLHSDDIFSDSRVISEIADCFSDASVNLVYGDLDYIDKSKPAKIVRHWVAGAPSPFRLKIGWMPPHPTVFIRSDVYKAIGEFKLRFRISADYDLMLRLFLTGKIKYSYIPRVLVKMRTGGESNGSVGRILRKSREDYGVLRLNGFSKIGAANALVLKNLLKAKQLIGS